MDGTESTGKRETGDDGSGKPTLRTIAELTGLAVTTVSRALGGAPQIALETREKVQRVAAEIGYLPDRAAQRLRTGRTNVISLVLDPHDEILGFGSSLVSGLTDALRDTSYHLVITPHFANVPAIDPVRYIMRNRMADGIVFSRTEPFDARVKLLTENGFPFICHGRTELTAAHPYVDYNNFSFAYEATKRLIAKGRKRLAIILPPRRFTFFQHIQYGFMSAVRESGIDFEIAEGVDLDSPSADIQAQVFYRTAEPNPPDGYICGGEVSALAVMAALSDRGLVAGSDVDIVAKQTSGLFNLIRPRIDTIYEDIADAGRQMGRLLLRRIADEPAEDLQSLQQPRLNFSQLT
ncbi:transcriptional regulator, LacI family [Mesorhizobium albiziae]|uniref:Transcriptional regulator, LacI family n=1 Tax=Neomesorhizobium albiziae TaxID=335020 RepID=A0A1I4DKQ8_9HYPH|nr:LacI family transcriptional regulator [Mesorhizobium albiziae]GLS31293.1 LacI family transcriptional regulator [Mesorhizobium albiziae]SFK94142.1 transcriptional regulator, LacI family [Mesorhizobium albiziae]